MYLVFCANTDSSESEQAVEHFYGQIVDPMPGETYEEYEKRVYNYNNPKPTKKCCRCGKTESCMGFTVGDLFICFDCAVKRNEDHGEKEESLKRANSLEQADRMDGVYCGRCGTKLKRWYHGGPLSACPECSKKTAIPQNTADQ